MESFNLKDNCHKIEDILLLLNYNEFCVMVTINMTNHGPMIPIQYNESSILQLSDNSILIILRNKFNINF